MIEILVDKGLVKNVADLYSLKMETLADFERMAEKSATNVIDQIKASKERGLQRSAFRFGHTARRRKIFKNPCQPIPLN